MALDPYREDDAPCCRARSTVTGFHANGVERSYGENVEAAGILFEEIDALTPDVFYDRLTADQVSTEEGNNPVDLYDAYRDGRDDVGREGLLEAYGCKALAGDWDINHGNFQVTDEGSVYPIDMEVAGEKTVQEIHDAVFGRTGLRVDSIENPLRHLDLETDGAEPLFKEILAELANSVDLERLEQRYEKHPDITYDGPATDPDVDDPAPAERVVANVEYVQDGQLC